MDSLFYYCFALCNACASHFFCAIAVDCIRFGLRLIASKMRWDDNYELQAAAVAATAATIRHGHLRVRTHAYAMLIWMGHKCNRAIWCVCNVCRGASPPAPASSDQTRAWQWASQWDGWQSAGSNSPFCVPISFSFPMPHYALVCNDDHDDDDDDDQCVCILRLVCRSFSFIHLFIYSMLYNTVLMQTHTYIHTHETGTSTDDDDDECNAKLI